MTEIFEGGWLEGGSNACDSLGASATKIDDAARAGAADRHGRAQLAPSRPVFGRDEAGKLEFDCGGGQRIPRSRVDADRIKRTERFSTTLARKGRDKQIECMGARLGHSVGSTMERK